MEDVGRTRGIENVDGWTSRRMDGWREGVVTTECIWLTTFVILCVQNSQITHRRCLPDSPTRGSTADTSRPDMDEWGSTASILEVVVSLVDSTITGALHISATLSRI